MQTISKWANDWFVLFDANKILSMVIWRKLNAVQHPPLFINNTIIIIIIMTNTQEINIFYVSGNIVDGTWRHCHSWLVGQ